MAINLHFVLLSIDGLFVRFNARDSAAFEGYLVFFRGTAGEYVEHLYPNVVAVAVYFLQPFPLLA
jgi:hypothetical protein